MRPTWDEYFLDGARWAAGRADCTRRKVGCVIVDPATHDVIQPGYNGSPAGSPGCLQGACPRGRHYAVVVDAGERSGYDMCACGNPWPCSETVDPGSSYDTGPGACISIHAEANAIIRTGNLCRGMVMYCTHEPCGGCVKLIHGAVIIRAVWPDEERGF